MIDLPKFLAFISVGALLGGVAALAQIITDPAQVDRTKAVMIGPNSVASWDAVTLDVNGNLETMSSYTIGIFEETADPNQGAEPLAVTNVDSTKLTAQLSFTDTLQDGSKYLLAVQAVDAASNVSEWSLLGNIVQIDKTSPTTPDGFKIRITVSVEVIVE